MNKIEFARQCGILKGMRFQAAPDSDTPEMEFEITGTNLKDDQDFDAVELTYSDGKKEIAAIECLKSGLEYGLEILNRY